MFSERIKQPIKRFVGAFGYRIQGTRYCPRQLFDPSCLRRVEFDDVICRRMFECGSELSFIQIGGFDGVTWDPLRKYIDKCQWRGVVVEPQAKAAEKLRQLYRGNDRVVILQAALDRECGSRTFYTVEHPSAPAWAAGLGSFEKHIILKHSDLIAGLQGMIREETVNCVTFDKVLESLSTQGLDLLQIDTEGWDSYLLGAFPFQRATPAIVHWEVKHLPKLEREKCLDLLINFGYRVASSGGEDMFAVKS